jgi:3-deoxy-D-arabino-heptulosonate 7-phosphate (DAHP) synthase
MDDLSTTGTHPLTAPQPDQATTIVQVRSLACGGTRVVLIGGRCTVEGREQVTGAAQAVGRDL